MFKDLFDDDDELPIWAIALLVFVPVFVVVFLLVRRRMMAPSGSAPQGVEYPLERAPAQEVTLPGRQAAETPIQRMETTTREDRAAEAVEEVVEQPASKMEPPKTGEPDTLDDLKAIEGIGPKIQEILYGSGIKTFRQIADTPVDKLREILAVARIPGDPGTWPEQAALAADGHWDDLVALQKQLKGGRRVE